MLNHPLKLTTEMNHRQMLNMVSCLEKPPLIDTAANANDEYYRSRHGPPAGMMNFQPVMYTVESARLLLAARLSRAGARASHGVSRSERSP